jgi:hypothetical protein
MFTPDDFTRVNNDVNGNPRYVAHFLAFTTPDDLAGYMGLDKTTQKYNLALSRAKPLGGRKFHNKQFGGGIVFTSYNTRELCERINAIRDQLQTEKA